MQKILKTAVKFILATLLFVLIAFATGMLLYRLFGESSFFLYLIITVLSGIQLFRIIRLPI